MNSVEMTGIDELIDNFEALLRDYPDIKGDLLEQLAGKLLGDVQGAIGGTGQVQSWQDKHVGSGKGYVAVRPKANTYKTTPGGKQYAVGYVTNAIENGHRHRRPSAVKKQGYYYKPRIKVAAVPGKHFYAGTRSKLQAEGSATVRQLAAVVAARLEGRG
ncbi:MAG TPA: hypothetical protein IAA67_03235 [Candidatus Avoscillospira stercorigallinarum]|uniref:Uncharacterized protein n=1 Tax=Candidatus Avoscillospira stercorigallinarum TaxID=2840708 RepID=A0A9D0Z7F0_9FIRM|nr:hypothetical protein [Candidatus Avoscillospira stercorigallinarum]